MNITNTQKYLYLLLCMVYHYKGREQTEGFGNRVLRRICEPKRQEEGNFTICTIHIIDLLLWQSDGGGRGGQDM
jgi:hypothetical protein